MFLRSTKVPAANPPHPRKTPPIAYEAILLRIVIGFAGRSIIREHQQHLMIHTPRTHDTPRFPPGRPDWRSIESCVFFFNYINKQIINRCRIDQLITVSLKQEMYYGTDTDFYQILLNPKNGEICFLNKILTIMWTAWISKNVLYYNYSYHKWLCTCICKGHSRFVSNDIFLRFYSVFRAKHDQFFGQLLHFRIRWIRIPTW